MDVCSEPHAAPELQALVCDLATQPTSLQLAHRCQLRHIITSHIQLYKYFHFAFHYNLYEEGIL